MPSEVPKSTTPTGFARMGVRTRARIERLKSSARDFAARYPNAVRGLAAVAVLLAVVCGWFVYEVLTGLPGREELRNLAESTELTTIYDAHDRRVFTIPTEHRIEVPIDKMSKNLTNAM